MIPQMKLVILYCFIASLFILNLEANPDSDYEKYGTAIFTSVTGNSSTFKNNTINQSIALHDSITIDSESSLTTGASDYVFFKLSNNSVFGLLENTQFKIQSFKQESFQEKDIRLDREPSKSYFICELSEGTIAVKSNALSPLSTFEIHLPDSQLELHSALCVISYRYNILHIALYEGNISLKTNDSITYINAPSYYVIDAHSLNNSIDNFDAKLSEAPTRWNSFKDYIAIENNRVIFFPDTTSSQSAAKPKLISSNDFFNQRFTRPRSFQSLEEKE
jgi:hypothetical protein